MGVLGLMYLQTYFGSLLSLAALASSVTTYNPVEGFDKNRHHFYEHERKVAQRENPKLKTYGNDNVRVAHFDTHWHGLSIEEYFSLADEISADVLVARGVPERQGHINVIRSRLTQKGFDASSVIHEPMAALTSGLLVGVRSGITVASYSPITVEGRIAAMEVVLNMKPAEKVLLVVLTLDAIDQPSRIRQLEKIHDRMSSYEQQTPSYMILGGFHSYLSVYSKELGIINRPFGVLTDAHSVVVKSLPYYTSWWGSATDAALVSKNMRKFIRDVNVWHTDRADCLPIVVDLAMQRHYSSPIFSTSQVKSRFDGIKRYFTPVSWKGIFCGLGITAIVAMFVIIWYHLRRNKRHTGQRIQGTAKIFSDNDLKIIPSDKQGEIKAEGYPNEKEQHH